MCVLYVCDDLPWHSRRTRRASHDNFQRSHGRGASCLRLECLDTNRVTNQVIFTGDASRSQPGWGCGCDVGRWETLFSRVEQTVC
jgi:hypothetical protein